MSKDKKPDQKPKKTEAPSARKKQRPPRVVIKNLRNRTETIMLEHDVYCGAKCCCKKSRVMRSKRRRKEAGLREEIETIKLCRSITLAPGGESPPLKPAAVNCADVLAGTNARPLRLSIKRIE